jgi:hypothetical protein
VYSFIVKSRVAQTKINCKLWRWITGRWLCVNWTIVQDHAQGNATIPVHKPMITPTTHNIAAAPGRPVSTANAIAMSLPFFCSPKSVTARSDTDKAK